MALNDTFTDTDGTALTSHSADSGHSWSAHPSSGANPDIRSNRLRGSAGATEHIHYSSWVPAAADYEVTAVFRRLTNDANHLAGVLLRMNTSANTWYVVSRNEFTGLWQLGKKVAGSDTDLDSFDGDETTATDYTMVATIVGSDITVTINGVERMTATDSAISAAGRVGTYFYSTIGTAAGVHLGSVAADDVGGGEPEPAAVRLLGLTGVGT